MAATADDIILHHYPESPYSEKVRLIFGLKGLPWRSVKTPRVMPKPDLVPLTGGYRRAPVMQIGADVYCDTQRIAMELERRFPEPSLAPGGNAGLPYALQFWSGRPLFQACVVVAFAAIGDKLPKEFLDDRAKFSGRTTDIGKMKAASPVMLDQVRAHIGFLAAQLDSGKAFLTGDAPGVADFDIYHCLWFVARAAPDAMATLTASFPELGGWMERINAIGHGTVEPMEGSEALDVARDATPTAEEAPDRYDHRGFKPGDDVTVTPDDTGRDPVAGTVIASSPTEISIRREDDRVGEVAVHFPRAGFVVAPA